MNLTSTLSLLLQSRSRRFGWRSSSWSELVFLTNLHHSELGTAWVLTGMAQSFPTRLPILQHSGKHTVWEKTGRRKSFINYQIKCQHLNKIRNLPESNVIHAPPFFFFSFRNSITDLKATAEWSRANLWLQCTSEAPSESLLNLLGQGSCPALHT